jgi:hypothetical protein
MIIFLTALIVLGCLLMLGILLITFLCALASKNYDE